LLLAFLFFAEVFAKSGKEAWWLIPANDSLFQASAEWPDEFTFVTGNDITRAMGSAFRHGCQVVPKCTTFRTG
jgi:hypothetical protein